MVHSWQTETFALLNQPLQKVVGDRTAKAFTRLRVHTVGDLLRHVPRRYLSGTETSDLTELQPGEEVAVLAEVVSVRPAGAEPRRRLEVMLSDGVGRLPVTFFGRGYLIDYWQRQLSMSTRGIFVGKVGEFQNRPQLTHPSFVMLDADGAVVGKADKQAMVATVQRSGLVGLYPATSALPTWTISATIELVLDQLGPGLTETLPQWVLDQVELPNQPEAWFDVHQPIDREAAQLGIERLRFDEALGLQLVMAYRRADRERTLAPAYLPPTKPGLLQALDAQLPFALTEGQQHVSNQVFADLAREHPMQRLLQGEVGSGKTVVALRAMARVIDAGHQAVLLAPTEVLATQHAQTLTELLGPLAQGGTLGAPEHATEVVLLTGSMPAAQKKKALLAAASGHAGIIVGTHAVLGDQVQIADLGLVVVDEQHRFGVEQRAALQAKSQTHPHELVMTATPIPRSVAMTVFGDLETSVLRELPGGRAEVQTTVVDTSRHPNWVDRAWQRVAEEVAAGRQGFIVCSRISQSQTEPAQGADVLGSEAPSDEAAESMPDPVGVVELAEQLASGPLAGVRLEVLHGRMPSDQKDAVMAAFAAGEIDVLVATTVIEVGVNVPNASVMVVMDADRFGISQLHQLRGRIGRGEHPGLCLLVSATPADSPAAERLRAVAASRDGFALAETDLAARREGNILGTSQSGTRSSLRLLRVLDHADLIVMAREVAEQVVQADPERADPGIADLVAQAEQLAAGDWLEKS